MHHYQQMEKSFDTLWMLPNPNHHHRWQLKNRLLNEYLHQVLQTDLPLPEHQNQKQWTVI